MRIKYKFRFHGRIRPSQNFPLQVGNRRYEFVLDNGFISHIVVSFPITEENYPRMITNPEEGVALGLHTNEPDFAGLRQEMRQIEGLLSFFNCRGIETENTEIEWIPESEEERSKLALSKISSQRAQVQDEEIPPVSFDLLARPVLAAARHRSEVPLLSFYRKGRNDFLEDRYIDAIYDFFFCLEYEYGQGKTRNYALKRAFLEAEELREIVSRALTHDRTKTLLRDPEFEALVGKYGGKTEDELFDELILLRGFLHHQSSKRSDTWGAEEHDRFRPDACYLYSIAHEIVWQKYERYVFDSEVMEQYKKCYEDYGDMR